MSWHEPTSTGSLWIKLWSCNAAAQGIHSAPRCKMLDSKLTLHRPHSDTDLVWSQVSWERHTLRAGPRAGDGQESLLCHDLFPSKWWEWFFQSAVLSNRKKNANIFYPIELFHTLSCPIAIPQLLWKRSCIQKDRNKSSKKPNLEEITSLCQASRCFSNIYFILCMSGVDKDGE